MIGLRAPPWMAYSGTAALQEAVAALHHYLPLKKGVDFESEMETESYDFSSYDHFMMFEFKVRRCGRGRSHDWTDCPYAHPGEKARRRDPRKYDYSGTACPDFRKGNCKKGDACEYSHGVFECWLHPSRYRTQPCKDGLSCKRKICFFAHSPAQLRVLSTPPLLTPDSYDASPLSQAKTLSFFSASGSGRACISPPANYQFGSSNSVNEMVACFENMQLGKLVVPLTCSWDVGSGSRRSSSLWVNVDDKEEKKEEEEEPTMERVESGKGLREKMFEKLSRENSLQKPGQVSISNAVDNGDVDWVSELVQ